MKNLYRKFFLVLVSFIMAGCANTGKPQLQIEQYLIDYPAPRFENRVAVRETVRVNRFSIASVYNSNNMIFRRNHYGIDAFNYNRWAVNPADMVGDMLLRDLRESGLFLAAFSRYAIDEGRYILQGGVDDFFLRIGKDGQFAVIHLDITLKDTKQRETTKRILYQKKYHREEPLKNETPRSYSEAMSQAMEKLSLQIITDVYQAVK